MNIEDIKAKCPELVDVHWEKANGLCDHRVTVRRAPLPHVKGTIQTIGLMDISFSIGDVPVDKIAEVLFYGDPWRFAPNEFQGLDGCYGTLDRNMAQNAANVLDGGGSGRHNTSIYLVTWDPQTAYLAGHEGDSIRCGLVIQDWRYIVRICNIDLDCGEPDLITMMVRAMLRLPTARPRPVGDLAEAGEGPIYRMAFYMAPRTAKIWSEQMEVYPRNAVDQQGHLRGIPIRKTSALRYDEPRVL